MTPNAAKSQLSRTLAWPTLEAGLKSLPDLHWRPAKGSRGRVKEGSQAKHRPWILLALASFSSSVVRPSPFWLKPITTSRNANNNLSVEKERRKGGWAAQTRVEMRVIPRSDVSSSYYEGAGSRRVGNNLVFAFLKLQIRSFPPVQVCVKIVRDKTYPYFHIKTGWCVGRHIYTDRHHTQCLKDDVTSECLWPLSEEQLCWVRVTLLQGNPQSFIFRRKLKFLFRDSSWDCQVAILDGLAWLAGPGPVITALSPDYFNLLSVPPMFQWQCGATTATPPGPG